MVVAGKWMRGCTYRACTRKCCVVVCCVVCRVVCGCGCLAPWRSVTDHRADSSLTHAHPPTQTHTHAHALMSCHCHHQCWLHSCRRLEGVVAPLSGSPGTAIMPHTPNSSFSLTTSCCSLFSSPLFALSDCILVDIASTGDRTTCNHTFKQPHSLLLQRQRFVASIPQFTWWYWLVVSHALVHSLHLLLCSRMNPRDVALYQSFVCLLAASTHSLSRSLSLSFHSFPSLYLALMKPVDPFYHFSLSQISSFICTYQDTLPAKLRTRDLGLV